MPERNQVLVLCLVYIIMSFLIFIKNWYSKPFFQRNTVTQNISIDMIKLFPLLLIGIFYVFLLLNLYPRMTFFPGGDIIRHFSKVCLISVAPQFYKSSYPWFHLQLAAVWITSQTSMEVFQTFLAFLGPMVILAFYVMAKEYCNNIDKRMPIIATVFWSLFTGFGWLYLLQKNLNSLNGLPSLYLVLEANEKSYWDLRYGQCTWISLWFRPINIAFTLLFVLIYLLKRRDFSRFLFILVCSFLVASLFLIHASQLILFLAFLVSLVFFGYKDDLRLGDALLSTFLGNIVAFIIAILLQLIAGIKFECPSFLTPLLIIVTLSAYLYEKRGWHFSSKRNIRQVMLAIISAFLIIYAYGIFTWLHVAEKFAISSVIEAFFVPWFFYPVLLGITGLLSLISLSIIVIEHPRHNSIYPFVYLFIVMFIIGRIASIVNIYFSYSTLWERRVIPVMFSAASILASLAFVKLTKLLVVSASEVKKFFIILFICMTFLSGTTSTFIFAEFRLNENAVREVIGAEELDAVSYLSSILEKKPGSLIYTVTERSKVESEFAPTPLVVGKARKFAWSSQYPELFMWMTNDPNYPPPYVYLHNRDKQFLQEILEFRKGYFYQHLFPYIPLVYNNSKVSIYSLPQFIPPMLHSDTVLVIPSDESSDSYLFVYDILSLGKYNYTVMFDWDDNIFHKNILILPRDISNSNLLLRYLSWVQKGNELLVFNTDGFGLIADMFFIGTNALLSVNTNKCGEAFLYSLANLSFPLTNIEVPKINNGIYFILENGKEENKPSVIIDDDQCTFWTPLADRKGEINVPTISDDRERKKGKNSLRIEVGKGTYGRWKIRHEFKEDQDWSNEDFICIYWYGNGTGCEIRFVVWGSVDHDNRKWNAYVFRDDFSGWKKIILPIKSAVSVGAGGSADLKHVWRIQIDGQTSGTWRLDRVTIDTGRWISVDALLPYFVANFDILSWDGTKYQKFWDKEKQICDNTKLYFLEGWNAYYIYKNDSCFLISSMVDEKELRVHVNFSFKLPPLSRIKLKLNITSEKEDIAVSSILGVEKINFPSPVKSYDLFTKNNTSVLGWYSADSKKIPYAIQMMEGDGKIIYINVYPIIKTLYNERKNRDIFYLIMGRLLDVINIKLPKCKTFIPLPYNMFVFKQALINGSIIAHSPSVFIHSENTLFAEIETNGSRKQFHNISSIYIKDFNILEISSQNIGISSGKGFYTSLFSRDSKISLNGENINLLIKLENKTEIKINSLSEAKILLKENQSYMTFLYEPYLVLSGEILFEEAYTFHYSFMNPRIRSSGQTLKIIGKVNIEILLSDSYTIVKEFSYNGDFERIPPNLQWDELNSFIKNIPTLLLLIILSIAFSPFFAFTWRRINE